MRMRYGIAIAIAFTLGCNLQPVTTTAKAKPIAKPRPSASSAASSQPIPLTETPRVVDTQTGATALVGKVKFVSNGGGNIISDNGASVISNNGGGIISDNGASLVSKVKYAVTQTGGASPESLLADAQIEVLDAAGNVLVTPDQKPITAVSDQQGNYQLEANLPNENLILRVRLFNGGQLFAFTTKDRRTATLDINTASSLGAAYVMEKYVKKQQAVLDKLPGIEADKLQTEMEAARGGLSAVPSYQPQELVAAAETLRGQAPQVAEAIDRIEALLLAGQSNLGNGLQATQVALALPSAVTADAAGNLYVAETTAGRIRKIAKDGTVSVFAGPGGPAGREGGLGKLSELVMGPDGCLYTVLSFSNQIVKIPPEGPMVTIGGNGLKDRGKIGGKATEMSLYDPGHLTFGPDGLLYFTEINTYSDIRQPGRILYIDGQGLLQAVPMPNGWDSEVRAFTVAKDGKVWFQALSNATTLYRQGSGGWQKLADLPASPDGNVIYQRMVPAPDNTVYVSVLEGHRIYKANADGTLTPVVGTGKPGSTSSDGPAAQATITRPAGMWVTADGALYFAEEGNGLVRRVGADGVLRTVAGAQSLTQVGDALTVTINQPGSLALDPEGRIVVAETASHTIKRLEGAKLTVIAGTTAGDSGDGGPATQAALKAPAGMAYHHGELYFLDGANHKIRKIDKQGVITTIVSGSEADDFQPRMAPDHTPIAQPVQLAVSPDGHPYWTESQLSYSLILRLKDGMVEIVAGSAGVVASDELQGTQGDGGPATKARLASPSSLAFDQDGNLYFADSGNFRIRKVDKAGVITTVAGMLPQAFLPAAIGGKLNVADGSPAAETPLWGPTGIQFDAQGNLFFAEVGTVTPSSLGTPGAKLPMDIDFSLIPAQLLPKTYARIRKLTPEGKIYNVTGPGTKLLADTTGDSMLVFPLGMIFDREGRLVIADAGLNQLKMLPKGSF